MMNHKGTKIFVTLSVLCVLVVKENKHININNQTLKVSRLPIDD